jgi:hypothetical protein
MVIIIKHTPRAPAHAFVLIIEQSHQFQISITLYYRSVVEAWSVQIQQLTLSAETDLIMIWL